MQMPHPNNRTVVTGDKTENRNSPGQWPATFRSGGTKRDAGFKGRHGADESLEGGDGFVDGAHGEGF